MTFPCTKCGLCCLHVGAAVAVGLKFPYAINPDGSCSQLDKETHLCKVYDRRPAMCNIEEQRRLLFPGVSQQEYFVYTANVCNMLMEAAGMEERIDVELLQNTESY